MADSPETRKEQRATARAERARAEAARAQQRKRLGMLGGAVAIAAVIVVLVIVLAGGDSKNGKPALKAGESIPGQTESNERFAGIPQKGITLGNPKAKITLVEFADLQCPFCREYTTTVFPTLVAQYVKTGQMKMVFRNVAFIGTDSVRAAQLAEAAALQNKLWPFIDLFYANQEEENSGYVTDDFLRKIGGGVTGLNVTKAMNERGIASVTKQLNDATTQWQSNGFQGTPSFLLGKTGSTLKPLNIQSFKVDQFTSKIDPLLGKQ
jgi:protein-disulfide isomerase